MRRRTFLQTAAVASVTTAAYPVLIEPMLVDINHYAVRLPGLARPLRIVQLSDLHFGRWIPMSRIEHFVSLAGALEPDLYCLTGDFVDVPGAHIDVAAFANALRPLTRVAPSFAVLGNHDGGSWTGDRGHARDHSQVEKILSAAGIDLLHNRHQVFANTLTLAGIGDLWSREVLPEPAFNSVPSILPVVLLNHNPDAKDRLLAYPWHLMLSGHTHGGQVRPPFLNHLAWTPVRDTRFVEGLHRWEGRYLHVNRGVGGIKGVRFNCRPEISVLNLSAA